MGACLQWRLRQDHACTRSSGWGDFAPAAAMKIAAAAAVTHALQLLPDSGSDLNMCTLTWAGGTHLQMVACHPLDTPVGILQLLFQDLLLFLIQRLLLNDNSLWHSCL